MSKEINKQNLEYDICAKEVKRANGFEHPQNIHSEKFQCRRSGLCCGSENDLQGHDKIYGRPERMYNCNLCSSKFGNASDLGNHVKQSHPTQSKSSVVQKFECGVCDKTFLTSFGVKGHMNIHLERFPCQDCVKYFMSSKDMKRHQNVHINKKYHCPKCKRRFLLEIMLNIHQKSCNGDCRPFKCPICSKGFTTKKILNVHKNVHLGKFKCSVCEKCCSNRSNLNDHKKIHANGKLIEVQEHSASTSTSSETNFERLSITCDYCSKVCESKDSLKQHCFDNHLGTFHVYSCQNCPYSSSNRRLMLAHCRKEHRNAKLFKQNIPNDEETQLLSFVCVTLLKKGIDVDLASFNVSI